MDPGLKHSGMTSLRSFNLSELESFLESEGFPKYRAAQMLDWLHKKHVMSFSEMKNIPKELQSFLGKNSSVSQLIPLETPESKNHESVKYLMKTHDDHILESVLIAQNDRRTVCVSTQLGCKIRCPFCASGKGKFGRNLSAGEIVEQVSIIARQVAENTVSSPRKRGSSQPSFETNIGQLDSRFRGNDTNGITNIVFMGMGEPFDNYDATMKAIEILTAEWGFGLGGRRITVSTSGITPMIERFAQDSRGRVRLSISLHSSDQETRSKLVPINKKYRLDDLVKTLEKIHNVLKRDITFEYTLIDGVNDSDKEAQGVGRIAARLGAKVNIIPYNPIQEMDFKTPSRERINSFKALLEKRNVKVTIRQTAGRDIDAACGQLRQDRQK